MKKEKDGGRIYLTGLWATLF